MAKIKYTVLDSQIPPVVTKVEAESFILKDGYFWFTKTYKNSEGVVVAVFKEPISILIDDPDIIK